MCLTHYCSTATSAGPMDGQGQLPDIIADLVDPAIEITSTIFSSEHFHLESCELHLQEHTQDYHQHLQGCVAPTLQGLDLAERHFLRLALCVPDEDVLLDDFFQYASPTGGAQLQASRVTHDGVLLFGHDQHVLWETCSIHPRFSLAFKFRFQVTSCSRSSSERRHVTPFQQVNRALQSTTDHYLPLLQQDPFRWVRSAGYEPQLSPEDITLLSTWEW